MFLYIDDIMKSQIVQISNKYKDMRIQEKIIKFNLGLVSINFELELFNEIKKIEICKCF